MILPRVVLHTAISLDGRTEGFEPNVELFYRLASTWQEDATLAGVDTLLAGGEQVADDGPGDRKPAMLAPHVTRPLLVVPDSRGRLRRWEGLLGFPYWRDGVALCSKATPKSHLDYLQAKSIDVIRAGDDRVDLRAALAELSRRHGVRTVRVDSGGLLSGALLYAGLVDEISLLIHPVLAGPGRSRSWFDPVTVESEYGRLPLHLISQDKLNNELVWLRYELARELS